MRAATKRWLLGEDIKKLHAQRLLSGDDCAFLWYLLETNSKPLRADQVPREQRASLQQIKTLMFEFVHFRNPNLTGRMWKAPRKKVPIEMDRQDAHIERIVKF